MNRKAPISLIVLTVITIVFSVGCLCTRKTDVWTTRGHLDGIVYNMVTGFHDMRVVCDDGYTVTFEVTKDVAYHYMDLPDDEELVVYARWYKCRQWRWVAGSTIAVVVTKPKRECKPCWWVTEVFGK